MTGRILVADPDPACRETLTSEFQKRGLTSEGVDSAQGGLVKVGSQRFDIAIVDLDLPDRNGMELVEQINEISPETAVIIVKESPTLSSSLAALRLGAVDYLTKPLNRQQIVAEVKQILEHRDRIRQNRLLHRKLCKSYAFGGIISHSPSMQRICDIARRVSMTDSNVIISGRSGCGKELIARAIHFNSARRTHPFMAVNCCAISEPLFESELFGHKKGAFTNAFRDKDGLFKVAKKGTLFFDEVAGLTLSQQAKLLRAIEFGRIMPVGAVEHVTIDVRFIASTSRNLKDEVDKGRFREDLYYRLNVIEIAVPSLKKRKEDIPPLVHHFIGKFSQAMNKDVVGIDRDALQILMQVEWRGEVRELENAIERAMIFCDGNSLGVEDLPAYLFEDKTEPFDFNCDQPLRTALRDFERHYIITNLNRHHGHRRESIHAMGLSESSFYRKIEKLGLWEAVPKVKLGRPNKVK